MHEMGLEHRVAVRIPAAQKRRWSPLPGFTLIELVLDISLLLILAAFVVILIDPVKQLSKAKDSGRKQDAIQIRSALDTYYNDYGCYPQSIPFGKEWQQNGVVYMQKVPQDPDCTSNPASCYVYQTNADQACPQWQVIYVKQSATSVTDSDCPLKSFPSSCVPSNYDSTWACYIGGSVDCDYVSSQPLIVPLPSITPPVPTDVPTPTSVFVNPTPTGIPGVTQSPTPATLTPTPTIPCDARYACTGGPPSRCNLVPEGSGTYCSSDCNGECL